MDKQQKLKIALPVLLIVVLAVWWPALTGSGGGKKMSGKAAPSRSLAAGKSGPAQDLLALSLHAAKRRSRSDHAQWGRNPFMIGHAPKALVLEGIMWDEGAPKAFIGGDIFGVGDSVGPNTITGITQTSVTMDVGGSSVTINIGEGHNF